MALTIANVMCRSMVLDRKPVADELRTRLHDVVMEEDAIHARLTTTRLNVSLTRTITICTAYSIIRVYMVLHMTSPIL